MLGTTVRASVSSTGQQGNDGSEFPRLSADGRYVIFSSQASNLVADDTNAAGDVFVRDLVAGVTVRVSLGNAGAQGNAASGYGTFAAGNSDYVVFASDASNLVAGDTNGTTDSFLRRWR